MSDPPELLDLGALLGQTVRGRYEVLEQIDRGGTAAIFRAHDATRGETVALKVLFTPVSTPGRWRPPPLLRLSHPHIVEAREVGLLPDGRPFLVMELLEGRTLAARIQDVGAIPERDLLAMSGPILSALSTLHGRGEVHGDLKPANVFLARTDAGRSNPKLLDLSIAPTESQARGMVFGSMHYLAPEQVRAEASVDHRVDVWAMGVLLYEAATGVLPFNDESFTGLAAKILRGRVVAPRRFRADLSESFEALILEALSLEPDARPADAAEMEARVAALGSAMLSPKQS